MRRPGRLARTLLATQVVVIAVAALTLVVVAVVVTPGLFTHHLEIAGETDEMVQHHALEALASTVAIAGAGAIAAALVAAALVSWFLVGRIARPVDDLAVAAQAIQRGDFPSRVDPGASRDEIAQLVDSFNAMVARLEKTEESRRLLLADLSHELRTPLATLEAYIDGIEDGVLDACVANLSTMRSQVDRMRRLTGDLRLTVEAGGHVLDLHLAQVDVANLLNAARAAAWPRYEAKGVNLTVARLPNPFVLQCDEPRMQQVLANLLENSLRHTPSGGGVTISGHRDREWVVLVISDTGDGLPPEALEIIFERLFRLDPSRTHSDGGGSGLGLSIARDIVRGHGGEITAQSAGVGQGTSMIIRLPRSPEERKRLRADPPK